MSCLGRPSRLGVWWPLLFSLTSGNLGPVGRPQRYDLDHPWNRQPFEDDREWSLFQEFLHVGAPRNSALQALARRLGTSVNYLEELSHSNGWKARVHAWEAHLDALRTRTVERLVEETAAQRAQRHMGPAGLLIDAATREAHKLLQLAMTAEGPGVLAPRDIARFLDIGVKLQRLCAGDIDPAKNHTVNVSALSVDELRALQDLQAKAGTG